MEVSPRFERRERRARKAIEASGPALGYASLACAVAFPLLSVAVARFVPEAGAALVTMGSVLAIAFGGAFGFGAFKLSALPGRLYGAMGMGLAALQVAFLAAALWDRVL